MKPALPIFLLWGYSIFMAAPSGAAELYLVASGNNLGNSGETPLKYAEKDATQLTQILKHLGGVPAQNAVLLLGENAEHLRKVILEINARIRAGNAQGDNDTVLLVYYSGHASTGGLHLGDSDLEFEELRDMVAGSSAKVRILVIDSCRSGNITRVKGAQPAAEFDILFQDRLQAEGIAVITSSASNEDSHESDQLGSSFFSHHLLNALRGAADKDRDGMVTLNEAYHYAYQQTLRSSGRTLQLQHPTYQYDIKGRGNLVLTRLANDRNRSGLLIIRQAGLYLVMEKDENGPVMAEVSVGTEGTRMIVPTGSYFVQKRDKTSYLEYQFDLSAGKEVDLDNLKHRTVKYARLVRKGSEDRQVIHGMYAVGGIRGGVIDGEGPTAQLVVGSSLDLSWMSIGLRARFSQSQFTSVDEITASTHREYALGLTAQRYLDFPWVSLSLGVVLECIYHTQQFDTPGKAEDRSGLGFGFGIITSVEIETIPELAIIVEGGPFTQVFSQGITRVGVEVGTKTVSPFSYWLAGGLGWRF